MFGRAPRDLGPEGDRAKNIQLHEYCLVMQSGKTPFQGASNFSVRFSNGIDFRSYLGSAVMLPSCVIF